MNPSIPVLALLTLLLAPATPADEVVVTNGVYATPSGQSGGAAPLWWGGRGRLRTSPLVAPCSA